MALTNPYASAAQVQAEIRNTSVDVDDAINAASRWIDWHMGRDFFEHDYTSSAYVVKPRSELVYGRDLFMPFWPIISITEVKEGTDVLVEDTDYYQESDRLIRMGQDWEVGEAVEDRINLKVKLGYDQSGDSTAVPTGLPKWINHACILVAAAFSGRNQKDVIGLEGQKETVIDNQIPSTVFKILGARNPIL